MATITERINKAKQDNRKANGNGSHALSIEERIRMAKQNNGKAGTSGVQVTPPVTAPTVTAPVQVAPLSGQAAPQSRTEIEQRMKLAGATMQSANQRITGYSRAGNVGKALEDERNRYATAQKEYNALKQQLSMMDQQETLAKRAEERGRKSQEYAAMTQQDDFTSYSSMGAAKDNSGSIPGNIVRYYRENEHPLYSTMTEQEVSIYDYLLGKGDDAGAQKYLEFLNEDLRRREGEAKAQEIQDIENPVKRTLATGAHAFKAGVDNAMQGTVQLFRDEEMPTSATQFASAALMEDMGTVGRLAYSAVNTVGNMLPSVVVGTLTGGAGGAVAMGASSSGNAYKQALSEGYDKSDARAYSVLVGASEAALQYAIGGISKLGGVADDVLLEKALRMDKAYKRMLATGAIKLGSEITEEEVQLFLEPAIKSFIMNVPYDAPNFEEMLETAIVTALSTGALEGGNILSAGLSSPYTGGAKQSAEHADTPGTSPAAPAPGAAPSASNDIATELVSAGATQAEAETLAPILSAVLNGEEISGNQAGTIAKNEVAVSILENATGETINTDAPLGEVKSTIRDLASRHSAQVEQTATEDTPAQAQAVEPQETAPDSANVPPVAINGKESVQEFVAELSGGKDLVNGQETRYTEMEGARSNEEAHLRTGGQWTDGTHSGGAVSEVESRTGGNQVRQEQDRPADPEAASLTYGEAVSTASLGIGKGSERATIRVVTGGDTAYTRAAKQLAKERGLRLTLFVGDNLNINGESVRAYITGDRAFVRADHSDFTSAQLMRHETGHDMIAKGEIDPQTVRERIAERFGGEQLDRVTQMYIEAYAGSGLTAEEIWEEVICDSLGDMNIFSETVSEGTARELLTATKVASADAKVETSRGPPAATGTDAGGKMSVELNDLADNIQKGSGIRWNGGRTITLSKSEYAAVVSRISSRYHYANTQHDGVQIIDRSTDGKNAQHYVYLYTDHGFGSYQIIGRLTYGRNDALINFLREEIGNDRTAEGVSAGTDRLRNFYEHTGGGRFTHYDRTSYDGNEQTNTGGRGVRAGSDRWSDRTDSDRYDGRSDPGKVTSKASRELDMKYMSAVNRGDTETARKMVVDAAKDAGYTVRAYHGTPGGSFTVFDGEKIGSNTDSGIFGRGFYFTTDKGTADVYATERGNTMPVYLRINNPWWAVAHRNIQDVADELGMDESALTLRGYGGRGKIVTPTMSQSGQFTAHLQEHGYDAVVVQHGSSNYEIVVFDNNAVKSADPVTYDDNGNVIPLSERFNPAKADMRFSLELDQEKVERAAERYRALIEEYGSIAPGENPARDVRVPKKTADNQKVSQTVRTILEAKTTPDAAVPTIEELTANGDFSYEVYTDKQAMADAENAIREKGYNSALMEWTKSVQEGEVSKSNTALGWTLYNQAANASDLKTAMSILTNMVGHQRNAAQAVQATRILKKMSPEAQLYGVQRSAQNLAEELEKRYGKDAPDIQVNEELARKYLEAETDKEREEAMRNLYRDLGRQMPSRFIDKWNAWRYLSMLGNPRTHVRNVLGNAFFAPVVAAKNMTATVIESAVSRVSGGKLDRTKGAVGFGKQGRELLSAAWSDYEFVADQVSSGGKYSDLNHSNQYIQEGRRIFKNRALEAARKGNSAALEAEDRWFSRPHYAYALAQYCKANGITAEQMRNGKGLDRARAYAIKEAQKATYRDTNVLSSFLSRRFSERGEYGKAGRAGNMMLDGILPFRKTPANILARGVEYSPIGLLNGIKQAALDVQNGRKTGAEAIDSISAGLTGTGLLALGLFLAAQGLVRGHGGEDDKENTFEELIGHQAYALELPNGTSITLDWLAPECLPFFVGVNMWEVTGGEDEQVTLAKILTSAATVTEPMLEMSCLQSLNEVFDAVGYASENGLDGLTSALASAATSYLTQGFSTLLGQAERAGQSERMTTYTEKDAFLTSDMQYTLGQISSRILGWDYQQIPYIDAWGRTESSGNAAKRAVDNFLNPAYTSTVETSPMEDELLRLYEQTGEGSVLPSRAAKDFIVGGKQKDLTAQEYVKYAQSKGQTAYKVLTAITGSEAYRKMSDAEKVKTVGLVYDYANATAKTKVSGYKPEGWIAKAVKTEKATGVKAEQYVMLYLAQKDIESLKEADGDTIANSKSLLVMEMVYNVKGLTDAQRRALFEDFGVDKTVIHFNKAAVQEKLREMRKKTA